MRSRCEEAQTRNNRETEDVVTFAVELKLFVDIPQGDGGNRQRSKPNRAEPT
jgi:hypothetical protein